MVFKYDAGYTTEDLGSLFDAIMPVWKKAPRDVPGLDPAKLHKTLKRLVAQWRKDSGLLDKGLQALLAVATATPWFSAAQTAELDALLDEMAGADSESYPRRAQRRQHRLGLPQRPPKQGRTKGKCLSKKHLQN